MARKIVPIKFIVLNVHQKLSQMEMNICRLDTIHECNTHRHRHRHTHTHTTVWHTRVHMAQFELEHNHKIFRPYCSETYYGFIRQIDVQLLNIALLCAKNWALSCIAFCTSANEVYRITLIKLNGYVNSKPLSPSPAMVAMCHMCRNFF